MPKKSLPANPDDKEPRALRPRVDDSFWQALGQKNLGRLCNVTFFEPISVSRIGFMFLNRKMAVDVEKRCLLHKPAQKWETCDDPLLELVTVTYLNHVKAASPLGRDIVGPRDLKEGHFFCGPHEFRTAPLLLRYGNNIQAFKSAAKTLKGEAIEMADAAYRLLPFPRMPLYYLLWTGDSEFKPRLQVLFDRSIERALAADAIWALVNRVNDAFSGL